MPASALRPARVRRRAVVALAAALVAVPALDAPSPAGAVQPGLTPVALDSRWGVNGLLDLGPEADAAVDVVTADGASYVLRDLLTSPARSSIEALTLDGRRVAGFGAGGRVELPHAGAGTRARHLLRAPDGDLVVVLEQSSAPGTGVVSAVRLDPVTGAVDRGWGELGTTTLPGSAAVTGAAIDPAGRLYVTRTSATVATSRGLVQRVTAEGELDASFGDGGTVEEPFGPPPSWGSTATRGVVALSSGAAVLGRSGNDGVVVRLDDTGLLDPGFAPSGSSFVTHAGAGTLGGDDDGLYVGVPGMISPMGQDLHLVKVDARTGVPVADWGDRGSARIMTTPCGPHVHDLSVSGGAVAVVVGLASCNPTSRLLVRVDPSGAVLPEPLTVGLDGVRPVSLAAVALDAATGSAFVTGDPLPTWLRGVQVPPTRDAVVARLGAPVPRTGFVPVPPARVLDTRKGIGAPRARVGAGGSVVLDVTGVGGVPATGVESVTLNVTAVRPTAGGHVTVHPSRAARPASSNLNLVPGVTTPAQVVVRVGADGAVVLWNAAGSVDLLADVTGWTSASTGHGYRAASPVRLLDTRSGTGAPRGRVAARGEVVLDLAPAVPVGAAAVVLNVTAVTPTAASYVTVYPDGMARPSTSVLNLTPGVTVPNLVTVPVGADGRVRLYNDSGSVHLLADLAGWYGTDAPDDLVPLSPMRIVDTRTNLGAAGIRMGPGQDLRLRVAGSGGVPLGATAAVLNVTGVAPSEETHLTVHPAAEARPVVSNLNLRRGVTQANLVVAKLDGDGLVKVHNARGSVDVVVDVAGYFTGGAPAPTQP